MPKIKKLRTIYCSYGAYEISSCEEEGSGKEVVLMANVEMAHNIGMGMKNAKLLCIELVCDLKCFILHGSKSSIKGKCPFT